MKTKIFLAIALPIAAIIAIMACTKDANETNVVDNENVLTVETYSYLGKLHNEGLTNVKNNFNIPEGNFSLSEKIDYIKNFNMEFLKSANINEFATQKDVEFYMDRYKNFADKRQLYTKCFTPVMKVQSSVNSETAENDDIDIYAALDIAFQKDSIDEFEYKSMKKILDYAKASFDTLAPNPSQSFVSLLDEIGKEFNNKKYPADSKYGHSVGAVLAIGNASNEWWTSNSDMIDVGNSDDEIMQLQIAPAMDAIGAIAGMATSLIAGGDFGDVMIGGFCGALLESTGILGRIGRWLGL
ncbi:MAG: hypothetical protein LBS69_11955 [Prevotellaceae bacterium]|jgi:hypothetical protein|nr:hypothetical protein [Prevotellaceae bacterium]